MCIENEWFHYISKCMCIFIKQLLFSYPNQVISLPTNSCLGIYKYSSVLLRLFDICSIIVSACLQEERSISRCHKHNLLNLSLICLMYSYLCTEMVSLIIPFMVISWFIIHYATTVISLFNTLIVSDKLAYMGQNKEQSGDKRVDTCSNFYL